MRPICRLPVIKYPTPSKGIVDAKSIKNHVDRYLGYYGHQSVSPTHNLQHHLIIGLGYSWKANSLLDIRACLGKFIWLRYHFLKFHLF